jgi:phospholipid/cholesterol/gamma-HCH transport system ATP-binding protein
MKSVFQISDRVAMVHGGRIISIGTPDEFKASTDRRVSDFISGHAPVKESVEELLNS